MAKKSEKRLYSDEMRELSFASFEDLKAYAIRWGLEEYDEDIVRAFGLKRFAEIPPATPMRINALKQIFESIENGTARIEWANRIEGKPTQTTVNLNRETESIEELERYTSARLDKLFEDL